ncbi:MAG: sugar ABC transporter permease, partial [Synergistaceae bacterium]|nr:sugar ABC transporter permease [Synergistaceae bacterium]
MMNTNRNFALYMVLPALAVMLIMTVWPMLSTVYYSFTDFRLLRRNISYIGLKNYASLLTNEYFLASVWNTVKFTLLTVSFEVVLGFFTALYVNSLKNLRLQKILRTVFLLPYLFPTVTVALSWRMMLSPNYGIVNQFLALLNLPVYNWFRDIHTAFGMLVVIDVWQNTPFVFLMIYAAMQSIPTDQYKAARIDGAGTLAQIWYITIPNLKTALTLCTLLRTIDTFRIFDKVNLLTGGGPAGSTTTITQYIYNNG